MEIIRTPEEIASVQENKVITGKDFAMNKSSITFKGKGNIFFAEDGVTLQDCNITFGGYNALIYLSKNDNPYRLAIAIYRDAVGYFGKDGLFGGRLNIVLSERQSLIVGNDALFSFGIWIKSAAPQPFYDVDSHERINPSQSVYIGDHVWVGQDAMLQQGTEVGSGALIAPKTVTFGDRIPSNSMWGGNPAQHMKDGVFFTRDYVHNWDERKTAEMKAYKGDEGIFTDDGIARKSFEKIDIVLKCQPTAEARLEQIQLLLAGTAEDKNRFYIPLPPAKQKAVPQSSSGGLKGLMRKLRK